MSQHYPNTPGSKGGGASKDAAKKVVTRAAKLRIAILELMLKGYRLTADEIAAQLRESILAIRPRVSELVTKGDLIKLKDRRKNVSGMTAHVIRHKDSLTAVDLPLPSIAKPRRSAPQAMHSDQNALFG
ncbi:hypothetical protein [Bradyrhizobium elkanii]|uniref:hypothetical protein n=1 Tax=Bradyrhizobium elkanii TaxID=29448 RepID=UPI00272B741A|nr:hypothetical protein [Bradyrhizobium elkanii]WLA86877.1 hypothetical protein QNJ99_23240 [Bradyrhizobium elkanii]